MKKLIIGFIVALVSALLIVSALYNEARKEKNRFEKNQTALLTGLELYKTKDSLNAAKIQQLELTGHELKKHETELVERIKAQGIKIKRLEQITEINTETNIEVRTVVRDSLVSVPGRDSLVVVRCMEYKDAFVDFSGCELPGVDSAEVKIKIPVNIDIAAQRVPKRFLFFKWGAKAVEVDVISYNPYTTINYARIIKLK